MNIIIYTLVNFDYFYFLLKWWQHLHQKNVKKFKIITILVLIILAILFAIGGKFLLTLPLTF